VNYFVLKRLRRRHLAWMTIPAIATVASAGVLLVGFNLKGVGTQVNQVRVVQVTPSSNRQYVVTYSGVVVPHRGDYTLSLPGGSWSGSTPNNFSPGDNRVSISGDPPMAMLPGMTAYSVRAVAAEGFSTSTGTLAADAHVVSGTLVGTVSNNTGETIEDAVVVSGGTYQQLGSLHPGQSQGISINVLGQLRGNDIASSIYPNTGYNGFNNSASGTAVDRERQRRAQVLRALTSNNFGQLRDPVLIGFQPGPATPPRVAGREVQLHGENVLVVTITPAADPRATTVKAGEVSARLVDFDGDTQSFPGGSNGLTTTVNNGSATLEFDLPGGGWQSANIGVGPSVGRCFSVPGPVPPVPIPGGVTVPGSAAVPAPATAPCQAGRPAASVYNFKTGQWDPLTNDTSGSARLNPGGGEVSADGLVLLRVTGSPGAAAPLGGIDIRATRTAPL